MGGLGGGTMLASSTGGALSKQQQPGRATADDAQPHPCCAVLPRLVEVAVAGLSPPLALPDPPAPPRPPPAHLVPEDMGSEKQLAE